MYHCKHMTMILVLVVCCLTIPDLHAQQSDIKIFTSEIPPFAYKAEDGEITGIATEVVRKIMHRIGHTGNIIVEPWKRVLVNSEQGRLSYPVSRTPDREKQYRWKWIGPILSQRYTLTVLASNAQVFNTIDDFKKMRIGVIRGAPSETRLAKLGFLQIDDVTAEDQNLKKLIAGRIDAWYATDLITQGVVKQLGIDKSLIKTAFSEERIDIYIVAAPDVDDKVVGLWQKALDEIKSDGTFLEIMKKYGIDAE